MRPYGLAIAVLGDPIALVSAVGRVRQTLAQDGVTYPVDELAVGGVGHLGAIHPEGFYRDAPTLSRFAPEAVGLGTPHQYVSSRDEEHPRGCRLAPGDELGTPLRGAAGTGAEGAAGPE